MSGTMTDQDFLSRGFKEYPPTYPIDPAGVKNKYQKCYSDEIGKRYFITVSEWEPIFDRRTGETWPINYEGKLGR